MHSDTILHFPSFLLSIYSLNGSNPAQSLIILIHFLTYPWKSQTTIQDQWVTVKVKSLDGLSDKYKRSAVGVTWLNPGKKKKEKSEILQLNSQCPISPFIFCFLFFFCIVPDNYLRSHKRMMYKHHCFLILLLVELATLFKCQFTAKINSFKSIFKPLTLLS